jgi:hypothetical protein
MTTTARATKRVRTTRAMVLVMRVTKAAATMANGDKDSHEHTTQQSSKAMEAMRAVITRTAKARAKARSRVFNCAQSG